jgi:hypothetical protein
MAKIFHQAVPGDFENVEADGSAHVFSALTLQLFDVSTTRH